MGLVYDDKLWVDKDMGMGSCCLLLTAIVAVEDNEGGKQQSQKIYHRCIHFVKAYLPNIICVWLFYFCGMVGFILVLYLIHYVKMYLPLHNFIHSVTA